MGKANPLRLVLDRLAINDGRFEHFEDAPVNCVTLAAFRSVSLNTKVGTKVGWWESRQAHRTQLSGVTLTKSSTVHFVERSTTGEE